MPRVIATLLVEIILALPASAASQHSQLDDVRTRLRQGDRIRIVDASGDIVDGRFDTLSGTAIALTVRKKVVTVPSQAVGPARPATRRLAGSHHRRRSRPTLALVRYARASADNFL